MMKEKGAWFIMQPILTDENAMAFPAGSPKDKKFFGVTKGTVQGIQMARKPDVKTAFGTDLIFDPVAAKKQSKMLAKLKQWCTAFEILNMATANNAKLVKMCGPRDPQPGKVGVIEAGALADMILVDGNPLENIDLVADPHNKFVMIMQDGKIFKNTIN